MYIYIYIYDDLCITGMPLLFEYLIPPSLDIRFYVRTSNFLTNRWKRMLSHSFSHHFRHMFGPFLLPLPFWFERDEVFFFR